MSLEPSSQNQRIDRSRISLGPVGDVITARKAAKHLLGDFSADLGERAVLGVMILTASCLQAAWERQDDITRTDLTKILRELQISRGARFKTSPMQFVQYVADELGTLEPSVAGCAIDSVRCALGLPQ